MLSENSCPTARPATSIRAGSRMTTIAWRPRRSPRGTGARAHRAAPAGRRRPRGRRPRGRRRLSMADLRPVTLITGASTGIGSALAHVFAANGHEVVLVARREQLLVSLADAIAATGARRPMVLRADV